MTHLSYDDKKPTVSLYTLGCKVNQYESQAIAEDFQRLGFVLRDFSEKCSVYVINTCTVTAESDKKSRQIIRRARKNGGSEAVIVVAGCFSQAGTDVPEADIIFGNGNKRLIATSVYNKFFLHNEESSKNCVLDISKIDHYDDMSISKSERTRAVVKIVDGCENKCSYCIIPSVRGKIRSRSPEQILDEITRLAKYGYKEVVLTGIETAAYGKDLNDTSLPKLLCDVNRVPGIERIRLGSLEPTVIKHEFIEAVKASQHVVPHFHLSLQSGSDQILRGMRRKYNTAMFYNIVSSLRENIPNVTFTTDIIVGFPGETEEMFIETCEFVKKCGFLYVHVFPYSPRKNTDAAGYPDQLSASEKKDRVKRLENIMLETRARILKEFDNAELYVLFEDKDDDGHYNGHTDNFIEVKLSETTEEELSGKIKKCILKFIPEKTEYMSCTIVE